MRQIARSILCLAFGFFLTAVFLAAGKKSPRVRYGIPPLRPGELWVSSVPVGLEVLSGDKPGGKSLGRTPLLLAPGTVESHVTVMLQKKEFGGKLPEQADLGDYTALMTHSTGFMGGEDVGRGLTYQVDPAKRRTVIALFQTRSARLSDWARRYPRGSNFRFREDSVRSDLAARGVPPEYVQVGIELLRRGGKVALPGSKGWVIAEVTADGKVSLTDPPS